MAKIKILFFMFDLGGGGAERVLVNLVNNLDPEKYDIHIRTIFGKGVNEKFLKPNIHFSSFFNRKPFGGFVRLLKLFSPKLLHKIFIKNHYDIEIAFMQHAPTRIISGANANISKFAWVHIVSDETKHLLRSYNSEQEFNKIYNKYDKIAFVSTEAKQTFEKYYRINALKQVVINVNNYKEIKRLSQENILEKISSDNINLIAIGRLCDQKRFDRLINALNRLTKEGFHNWHLYILGEGPNKENLICQAENLNLSSYISFLNYQQNPYKYLSKMDVFVCSSKIEGYSTAATEAIYLGIPIITTDCGGMHDIIRDSNAGLIEPNSEEGLYNGLRKVLAYPHIINEMKTAAQTHASFFTTENAIKSFEEFIGT